MTPDRDWRDANPKREFGCRICGKAEVELAHVIGRSRDRPKPGRTTRWVHPDSVVPLCPDHHRAYDAHELELLPYLTVGEQVKAVQDAGGIELARKRICRSWICPNCGAEHVFGQQIPGSERCLLCGHPDEPVPGDETELIEPGADEPDLTSFLPPFLRRKEPRRAR